MDTAGGQLLPGGKVTSPSRLEALHATGLLDFPSTPALDAITGVASQLLGAPVALVSLVGADRQCFVSQTGLEGSLVTDLQTPLSHSYCRHVVETDAPVVAPDARLHPLLSSNPAIDEYDAIAYLGVPVRTPAGQVLGSLCVIDSQPREWTAEQIGILEQLSSAVSSEFVARLAAHEAMLSATRMHRILENAHDAFIATDGSGFVSGWNSAAETMFGWAAAEALGQPLAELIIPERYRSAHDEGLRRVRASGTSALAGQRIELEALHRGGREFPIELTLTVLEDVQGLSFHAFVRDIRARKRNEMLRAMEYEIAAALASAPSATDAADAVVACLHRTLRWPYVEYWHRNAAGDRLVRLSDAALDDKVAAPMRESASFASGQGLPGRVWATGQAHWLPDLSQSEFTRAPAAARAGLRTTVAVPVRSGSDVVGVLLLCSRRRTDQRDDELMASLETVSAHVGQFIQRRRAEELELELVRAHDDFDRVMRNVNDHLWTVEVLADDRSRSVYSSPSGRHIFGGELPADADMGHTFLALIHPEDRTTVADFHATLAAGRPAEVECRLVGLDGVTRWVWTRGTPRSEGNRRYVDGVCTDVTARFAAERDRDAAATELAQRNRELESMNEQLGAANGLKLDLMGMLSHEIGNPLASIVGYAEVLLEESESLSQLQHSAVEVIARAAQRVENLRREVLTMCTLDAGRIHARPEPVALADALAEALVNVGAVVPVTCPAELKVLVHPAHLQHIITNLVGNAVKYAGGASSISVDGGDRARIHVHDDGPGVPDQLRPHLFDRFTRATDTASTTKGHGLGLYIVKGLAEANNGGVTYEPRRPTGSTFTLQLPVCHDERAARS